MKWAGYVVNMEDIRSELEIFVKKLKDSLRYHTCGDCINIDLK
jgi:hypothetical protein